jgi:pilus assembly protein CpaB
MRSKSIILLVLALGCGLIASIGISQVMEARGKTPADAGDKLAVFVAMADINAREVMTAQNIKLEEWPKSIIPHGALTKLEEVEGKRSRMKLYAGEPILSSKLLGTNDNVGAAKDIPAGYRVAYVKVDPITGSSNLILPGDRVDVLVFKQPGNDMNATAAKIVLQDIKVFAVDTHTETEFARDKGDQSEPMSAKTIALLITPEQSVILHAASEIGGSVRLVLRNPDDNAHVTAFSATVGDIFGSDRASDRTAEKTDEKKDIAAWLNQQKEKLTPPPAPQPVGPQRKMVVMYGAELLQIDLPGKGELPRNPLKRDAPNAASGTPSHLTRAIGGGSSQGPSEEAPDDKPTEVKSDE